MKERESCKPSFLPYGSQEGKGYLSPCRNNNEGNAWILQSLERLASPLIPEYSGINKEQRESCSDQGITAL